MSLPTPSPRKRNQAPQRHTLADAAARRVQRPAPLRQAVYDAIVDLIVQGTLQRGQHLVESELAEYLGVSRQPVREALQRLQTDGWIDLRPAQGAFVHTPSEDEVDQLLGVRTVLETYSARLAAEHATPEDVNRLWALQQDGLNALAANDHRRGSLQPTRPCTPTSTPSRETVALAGTFGSSNTEGPGTTSRSHSHVATPPGPSTRN
jgi:DNA-binding transcriptional regulator YhcF (GntR family)